MMQTRWVAIGIAGAMLVLAATLLARRLRGGERSVAVVWENVGDAQREHAA